MRAHADLHVVIDPAVWPIILAWNRSFTVIDALAPMPGLRTFGLRFLPLGKLGSV